MTNYEGAHSRVQKAEALTPGDPAVWESQPRATWRSVLLSCPRIFSPVFLFPHITIFIPFMPGRWEGTMLPNQNYTGYVQTQNDMLADCRWLVTRCAKTHNFFFFRILLGCIFYSFFQRNKKENLVKWNKKAHT